MPRVSLKTWNCFGAAQTIRAFLFSKEPPDPRRFELRAIREQVESVDIVCLQELFVPRAEGFFDRLAHPFKHRVPNGSTLWPLTFGGSGLGIASRFPIVTQTFRTFSPPSVLSERFARKGLLHARIALPGDGAPQLDVITTHMQSGYDVAAERVRERQIRELRAFADQVGAVDRPLIVCGDLNIDGLLGARDREYATLAQALSGFEDVGASDDRPTFHPHPDVNPLAHRFEAGSPKQRIDYVFYRPAVTDMLRVQGSRLALDAPFHEEGAAVTFASDHFAIRVDLEVAESISERASLSKSELLSVAIADQPPAGTPLMQTPTPKP